MVPSGQTATVPQLHKFLGFGVTSILVMFAFLAWIGMVPLLRDDPGLARTLGYAGAGVVAILVGVVLFVVKPRVPRRAPAQSVAQYWANQASAQQVLLVWFLLEGAGVLAAIAFVLSGEAIAAAAAVITAALLWMNGPRTFANP